MSDDDRLEALRKELAELRGEMHDRVGRVHDRINDLLPPTGALRRQGELQDRQLRELRRVVDALLLLLAERGLRIPGPQPKRTRKAPKRPPKTS